MTVSPSLDATTEHLPDDFIFRQLVECAQVLQGNFFIDRDYSILADHTQLVHDVLYLRKAIYEAVPAAHVTSSGLLDENHMFICLLAPKGYEYIVGCLAILSVGGAMVPLAPSITPDEAGHFIQQCGASLLIVGSKNLPIAAAIQSQGISVLSIKTIPDRRPLPSNIINSSLTIPSSRPGMVGFTSGSTGPPKGAVLPRACFHPGPLKTGPGWICPAHRAAHWTAGATQIMHLTLEGIQLDFMPSSASAEEFWERIRQKRVTVFSVVPRLLVELKGYFEQHIRGLPAATVQEYLDGVRHIRVFTVDCSIPSQGTMDFWEKLLQVPVTMKYGATEAGGYITMTSKPSQLGSVGRPLPDTQVKLSSGDHGEIWLKSPRMFLRYLNNPAATEAAIDADGFYHTGDLAHLDNDEYIFEGRSSADFVRLNGYMVPILYVEQVLMSLPYVFEAYVVAIPDAEFGERVATLIKPHFHVDKKTISLDRVREDLLQALPRYMLPTVHLTLSKEESVPLTSSGKVSRRTLRERYFGHTEGESPYNVETCKVDDMVRTAEYMPWSWAGVQSVSSVGHPQAWGRW